MPSLTEYRLFKRTKFLIGILARPGKKKKNRNYVFKILYVSICFNVMSEERERVKAKNMIMYSSIIQHMVFIFSAFMLDSAALIPNDQSDDLSFSFSPPAPEFKTVI